MAKTHTFVQFIKLYSMKTRLLKGIRNHITVHHNIQKMIHKKHAETRCIGIFELI